MEPDLKDEIRRIVLSCVVASGMAGREIDDLVEMLAGEWSGREMDERKMMDKIEEFVCKRGGIEEI